MQANSSSQLQADFLAIYMPPSAEKMVYTYKLVNHVCIIFEYMDSYSF